MTAAMERHGFLHGRHGLLPAPDAGVNRRGAFPRPLERLAGPHTCYRHHNHLLVQEFPGFGTIKSANPSCLDDRWIEVAEVYAHPRSTRSDGLPMRYAAARRASTQRETLVAPHVAVDRFLASDDLHLAWVVVTPEPGMAAADRAVAPRKPPRLSWNLNPDCAAVARTCEHGTALSVWPDAQSGRAVKLRRHGRIRPWR